ncbi:MAG: glutamyl-tRNA reductase [Cytophagaceae bacterium]|nr:glutamyl-tRNA reductase [Cytophagaceae bacterium]MDW8457091.1 glutamyl-tRNA reductase [Cytophagaceae bacterium]
MTSNFKAVGISHKTANIVIREKVALNESESRLLLSKLKEMIDAAEILVLSTCNRTEVYYASEHDYSEQIIKIIALQKGISSADIRNYFVCYNDHGEAVQHLFDVAIGLESQVVGDVQIINQVKNAYQYAADANTAGPFLHRLLHTIFFTNKKVVQETAFRDGAASVSYAAANMAEQLVKDFINPKALVIGLGEMGADIARNLKSSNISDLTLCNRTFERAQVLANELNAKAIKYEDILQAIAQSDVIICALSKPEPIVTYQHVSSLPILSHKFFIDVSVPRSIEPAVEEVPGVLVYHLDDIKSIAQEALEKRIKAIPRVKEIISESIQEFNDWTKEMMVSPTINKLKNALESIRQEEINRYLKQLTKEEAQKLDMITKNMMQKIIKLPVLQLKAACKRGEAETLIDVLNDLFDLEKQPSTIEHKS